MKANLIINEKLISPEVEVVEKKCSGHPDTLADALAEHLSCEYSKYTLERFGFVLHHNFDKVGIMGGSANVEFGAGKIVNPIRVLLNGRASYKFGNEEIDVRSLLSMFTLDFFRERFTMLDVESDIRIIYEVSSGSSPGAVYGLKGKRDYWFAPRDSSDISELKNLNCNDTSLGCAYHGNTLLERIVNEIDNILFEREFRVNSPWLGTDIKIMGYREDKDVSITIAIPQICTHVKDVNEYLSNKELLKRKIINACKEKFGVDIYLKINARDKINLDDIDLYLTYTGSSIEMGDEGFVGRGNRIGGLITPRRFYSMEGICGKNPIYHTGKIYTVLSYVLASKIAATSNLNCYVEMVGQSGHSLNNPWKVSIYTDGYLDQSIVNNMLSDVLSNISTISKEIIEGKYVLY